MNNPNRRKLIADPSYFTATPSISAVTKARMALTICTFIDQSMDAARYTPALHEMLGPLFGSPPMDHAAFCARFFLNARTKYIFLMRVVTYVPQGDPATSLCDVERLIRAWCLQHALARWSTTTANMHKRKERALLVKLLTRYGLPEQFKLPGQ